MIPRLSCRSFDPATDLRWVQDTTHAIWRQDPTRLNFEVSFGTMAWERGGEGHTSIFERDGGPVGWARLAPGYNRIREPGVWDVAPPALTWVVDPSDTDPNGVLIEMVHWAEERIDEPFTTSHAAGDRAAASCLHELGYEPDDTEPFGIYLQQRVHDAIEPVLADYRFTTMADLDDAELRAEAHRVAWDGSTRSADDVRATMTSWPYRADLDVVALAEDGSPAASAIVWFHSSYDYGEFEPVGTAAAHRGRGVGAAVLRFGLWRLREAGAAFAVVGARGDDDYPVPRHLYRSVGFEAFTTQRIVRKR